MEPKIFSFFSFFSFFGFFGFFSSVAAPLPEGGGGPPPEEDRGRDSHLLPEDEMSPIL